MNSDREWVTSFMAKRSAFNCLRTERGLYEREEINPHMPSRTTKWPLPAGVTRHSVPTGLSVGSSSLSWSRKRPPPKISEDRLAIGYERFRDFGLVFVDAAVESPETRQRSCHGAIPLLGDSGCSSVHPFPSQNFVATHFLVCVCVGGGGFLPLSELKRWRGRDSNPATSGMPGKNFRRHNSW